MEVFTAANAPRRALAKLVMSLLFKVKSEVQGAGMRKEVKKGRGGKGSKVMQLYVERYREEE